MFYELTYVWREARAEAALAYEDWGRLRGRDGMRSTGPPRTAPTLRRTSSRHGCATTRMLCHPGAGSARTARWPLDGDTGT